MQNPVKRVREECELSQQELAVLADLNINTIRNAEKGLVRELNPKLIDSLRELGYDGEEIKQEYRRWREEWRDEIIKEKRKEENTEDKQEKG